MLGGRKLRFNIEWSSSVAASQSGTRPFAQNAKERGTRSVAGVCEDQRPGHPPLPNFEDVMEMLSGRRLSSFWGGSVDMNKCSRYNCCEQDRKNDFHCS